MKRVLFVSRHCYLDDSNGAAVSSRDLMQTIASAGYPVEVLSSITLDLATQANPVGWFAGRGWDIEGVSNHAFAAGSAGIRLTVPAHISLHANGIPVTLSCGNSTRSHEPDDLEIGEFLQLFRGIAGRNRPDIVMGYGGDILQGLVFRLAREMGAETIFNLHNCRYRSKHPFQDVCRVRVPSEFAARFYKESLELECTAIPNPIRQERIALAVREPKYLVFVNPTLEKGVCAFARIAEDLGIRRPDIPILIVEAGGTEATVAACGLDLKRHGNVFFMEHTPDPRQFYGVSRAILMPSLVSETFGRVAAEAMCNGIPVVASDRGALPETLGNSGIVLPLPERLPTKTYELPSSEEVRPWVEAIIRLWDDQVFYEDQWRCALSEARRWSPEVIERRYRNFLEREGDV